jgi:hypothetical protein
MDFLDELNDGESSDATGTERIWQRRRGRKRTGDARVADRQQWFDL